MMKSRFKNKDVTPRKTYYATILLRVISVEIGLNNQETVWRFSPPDNEYGNVLSNIKKSAKLEKMKRNIEKIKSNTYITAPWHSLSAKERSDIEHYMLRNSKKDDFVQFKNYVVETLETIASDDDYGGNIKISPIISFFFGPFLPPLVKVRVTFTDTLQSKESIANLIEETWEHYFDSGDTNLVAESISFL